MAALAQRAALTAANSLSSSVGAINRQSGCASGPVACVPVRSQAKLPQYEGLRKGALIQSNATSFIKSVTKTVPSKAGSGVRCAVATEVEKETEASLNIAEDVTEVSSIPVPWYKVCSWMEGLSGYDCHHFGYLPA
jgi:hypothetical protein